MLAAADVFRDPVVLLLGDLVPFEVPFFGSVGILDGRALQFFDYKPSTPYTSPWGPLANLGHNDPGEARILERFGQLLRAGEFLWGGFGHR